MWLVGGLTIPTPRAPRAADRFGQMQTEKCDAVYRLVGSRDVNQIEKKLTTSLLSGHDAEGGRLSAERRQRAGRHGKAGRG